MLGKASPAFPFGEGVAAATDEVVSHIGTSSSEGRTAAAALRKGSSGFFISGMQMTSMPAPQAAREA